jgi:uncharacterized damage-inducible protein DinB
MFRTVSEFVEERLLEEQLTRAVIRATTSPEILNTRAAPGSFSFGELSWHISQALSKIGAQIGIAVPEERMPELLTAEVLEDEYNRSSEIFRQRVELTLTDADLSQVRPVYGFDWTVGYTLLVITKHEIHHRGQMTALLRLAGVRPPKVYG